MFALFHSLTFPSNSELPYPWKLSCVGRESFIGYIDRLSCYHYQKVNATRSQPHLN